RPAALAARSCVFASAMSGAVHGTVAGPILSNVTPAALTVANASAPSGAFEPGSGPLASTIGNTFVPLLVTVPSGSKPVTDAPAPAVARGGSSRSGRPEGRGKRPA